nr:hypothetical protein [Sinomonas atrocyanea]
MQGVPPEGRSGGRRKDARPIRTPSTLRGSTQFSACSAAYSVPSSAVTQSVRAVPCGTWASTVAPAPWRTTATGGSSRRQGPVSASARAARIASAESVGTPRAPSTDLSVSAETSCRVPSHPA